MNWPVIGFAFILGAGVCGYVEEKRLESANAEIAVLEAEKAGAEAAAMAMGEALRGREDVYVQARRASGEMEEILADQCDWSAIPVPADVCRRLRGQARDDIGSAGGAAAGRPASGQVKN